MLFIGNQTSCWAAAPLAPFDFAVAQGFEAFEWFPDKKPEAGWDESDLPPATRQSVAETARRLRMHISLHARLQANPLTQDGGTLLAKDLELALDLGAGLLNIHLFHEQGLPRFIAAILPLIRATAEAGLKLAIENTPLHSPEQFNDFFAQLRILKSIEVGHVGMCLDIGHANLSSSTRNDYLGFYDRLDPRIPLIHLHLHENWGDSDSHLPVFTGPSAQNDAGIRGLLARLQRRSFSGAVILEQWPHPPELLKLAHDRLLPLWDAEQTSKGERTTTAPLSSPAGRSFLPTGRIAAELVDGNERCRSWREKLGLVRGLLARKSPALTRDDLIDVAIYLRFLGTGELPCVEDGRHFRPAHHAHLAAEILRALEKLSTPENAFIVRKIYPWLPSPAADFQRPEPLTRIRDIAHRNDIPPDLKREIKTTLQNKLHRCAGPEDLETSAALLARVTAPGAHYSPGFIEQFRIFHRELEEFFNAQSVEQRLENLSSTLSGELAGLVRRFLKQKGGQALRERLVTFETLTALRRGLLELAGRSPGLEGHPLLLADIGLEDFAFVLLSELINACAAQADLSVAVESQFEALVLALENLELSGVEPAESRVAAAELRAWGRPSPSAGREELLRLKATLLRCRRLAEQFSAKVISLFANRAQRLGRALGVAEPTLRVFSEGEIRGQLVFQASKLTAGLLRQIRGRLKLPPWDVLVAGRVTGRVLDLSSFNEWNDLQKGPAILLLRNAAGDEEIPKAVVGLVLAHELPHLSHLAVRARQAGIVFVASEEPSEFDRLRQFAGKPLALAATVDRVDWTAGDQLVPDAQKTKRSRPHLPKVHCLAGATWIPLDQAVAETAGGKAAGARRLAELSQQPGAGFHTPKSLVVPFGVMEAALRNSPQEESRHHALAARLESAPPSELEEPARELRDLILGIQLPIAIEQAAARQFGRSAGLVVRSSSNCEDLPELAGAGLYESVVNVPSAGVGDALKAVWASLWTERAVLGRRESAVQQAEARMAVLIQELVAPDFAFVLHTVNPLTRNPAEVYAEIVVGLGETLVGGAVPGNPYRLLCSKQSGEVVALAFANFSHAFWPKPGGGTRREVLDYSRVSLSCELSNLLKLGQRLGRVGEFVERGLGVPQDIEGVVAGQKLYLVQTRPQQGLQFPPQP